VAAFKFTIPLGRVTHNLAGVRAATVATFFLSRGDHVAPFFFSFYKGGEIKFQE
jgi:hypothetical protein